MTRSLLLISALLLCLQINAQDFTVDSLKYQVQLLENNQQHIQLNLGKAEKQFKKGILISTIGYSVTIAGGLMLGGKNDELGTGLLVAGGAIGIAGTFILVDSFKYLGRASNPKTNTPMKKILSITCLLLASSALSAQTCNEYFPLSDGTRWVMESFNHKNKFQSKSVQTVTDTQNTDEGYSGRMTGEIYDSKDKPVSELDYELKCADGKFYISMNSMLSKEQMEAYSDMDVSVDGDFLELPSNLTPGMELKNANIEVQVKKCGCTHHDHEYGSLRSQG